MKWNALFSISIVLCLAACAVAGNTSRQVAQLDGKWTLSVYQPETKKTLAEVFGTRVVELEFDKSANKVSGSTGCNRFAGTYTADTATLTFSENRALTKMACPDYNEQLVLDVLNEVNRYRLIEGQLELMQNNKILLIFARNQ